MNTRFGLTILTLDCLPFWKIEQWKRLCLVDSVALLQLQIGFSEPRKLWLKPKCILLRQAKPNKLGPLKVLLRQGLLFSNICFLKTS